MRKNNPKIAIIGAGTGGIMSASRLKQNGISPKDITLIAPNETHYYQPGFSLVGCGDLPLEKTEYKTKKIIPKGAEWIQDKVELIKPQENKIITELGDTIPYDYLIVAPGIQMNWDEIPGLIPALEDETCPVVSNYSPEFVNQTKRFMTSLENGHAIFIMPNSPIKCGGAPLKALFTATDIFRKKGLEKKITSEYCTPAGRIFPLRNIELELLRIFSDRDIELSRGSCLTGIQDGKALFKYNPEHEGNPLVDCSLKGLDFTESELVEKEFNFMHVTPPMSAPTFIRKSGLADKQGWVDINKYTLQHNQYPNIFGIGDAGPLPRTAAAARKQAPVLARNLVAAINGEALTNYYNGYTCCPIITQAGKNGKGILAEFTYDLEQVKSLHGIVSQERPDPLTYRLKKEFLTRAYEKLLLRGIM